MDFVEWCDLVLHKIIETTLASSTARSIGVHSSQLAQTLFKQVAMQSGFHGSKYHEGMHDALKSLQDVFLVEILGSGSLWKATKRGRDLANENDMTPLWQEICQEKLGQEQQQLLHVINTLSPHEAADHAWVEDISHEVLLAELGWTEGMDLLWPVSQELEELNLISCLQYLGPHLQCHATYRGLVWETRRGFTMESSFIDNLVDEWETTTVDFKRELSTDTASQVAELIKDVLSLATTKTSGQRWMIIGFDDKTHTYYGPPNPKLTQNHLEQLMKQYTKPMVEVHYTVVDYRKGSVGKLEVRRDPEHIPYRVAKSVGAASEKKRVVEDQIFVRHGSQVEPPTSDELQSLLAEGEQARSQTK
jgi:Divergent AAA domain.